jgi:CRISPR-associated protein Cmr3
MKYLVTLKPLEPFLFGGTQTFGTLGDKEAGSYLVTSRQFPQQTAVLGMLRKELMTQAGLLTRKRRGEWVDKHKKVDAINLVGYEKFSMREKELQDFGMIEKLSPIFLMQRGKRYLKKVDIDSHHYEDGVLKGYNPKENIYDNFVPVELDAGRKLKSEDIFKEINQTGNKKGGEDNSLFKKTSYILKDGFTFAFYIELDTALKSAMVSLGADRSAFMMDVKEDNATLDYADPKGYLTLLSDALIQVDIKSNCDFAITSELSHRNLKSKKSALQKNTFEKSETVYLYEKGSVFINPSEPLLADLNQENLQQIGYNIYSRGSN